MRLTLPANGVYMRTVLSSFHVSRPFSVAAAASRCAAASDAREDSCGLSGGKTMDSPLTFAAGGASVLTVLSQPAERTAANSAAQRVRRMLLPSSLILIAGGTTVSMKFQMLGLPALPLSFDLGGRDGCLPDRKRFRV